MTVINVRQPVPPGKIATSDIRSGRVVGGGLWRSAADLVNHLRSCGGQLVCAHSPNVTVTQSASVTLEHYIWPRGMNRRCAWLIKMTRKTAGDPSLVSVTAGLDTIQNMQVGHTPGTVGIPDAIANSGTPTYLVQCSHDFTTPGSFPIAFSVVGGDVLIQDIACVEIPAMRVELGAYGASANIGPGFAIASAPESGLSGLASAASTWRSSMLRACFDWSGDAFTTTSTSFQQVFVLPPKILIPRMSSADGTSGTVQWAARVYNAGGTGEIRATAESGASTTLSIPSGGSPDWVTGVLTVDREDLSDSAGGQSGRKYGDAITFELRRNSGGTAEVSGISVAYTG